MSDIYNEHLNSQLQSHADILELATALSADGIYYSEREQILNELESRRFRFKILVDRVSNTYSTVPDDSLRKGRTIQGEIVDTEIEVKIQLPDSLNDEADGLTRGDSYEVEGIVNRWVSGLDQFELWGTMPSDSETAAEVSDSTEPDPDDVTTEDAPDEQPTADDSDPGPEEDSISDSSADSSEDREETPVEDSQEGTERDPAEETPDDSKTDDSSTEDPTPEPDEVDVQDSLTQDEQEGQQEQAEVDESVPEDDASGDEADVEPDTAEPPEETSEEAQEDTTAEPFDDQADDQADEQADEQPDDQEADQEAEQVAEQVANLFEADSESDDLYADESVDESDDVQNTVLKIVAGLGFAEQIAEAEKKTDDADSGRSSVRESKPKYKPTDTGPRRGKSQKAATSQVKGCLIAMCVIIGIPVILTIAAEMLEDAFRTSNSYDYAYESPANPQIEHRSTTQIETQTKANEADHITWLIGSHQITALDGVKRLLPKTADNDKARKTIVQQFAIRPIGISELIRDELMNAPIKYVVPLHPRLKNALTHPWSTDQHKPLLEDVINRIETEGGDIEIPTESTNGTSTTNSQTSGPKIDEKQLARARQLADFLLNKLDTDADGELNADEINQADNPKNTRSSDLNKDGKITSDELVIDIYNKTGSQPKIESLENN